MVGSGVRRCNCRWAPGKAVCAGNHPPEPVISCGSTIALAIWCCCLKKRLNSKWSRNSNGLNDWRIGCGNWVKIQRCFSDRASASRSLPSTESPQGAIAVGQSVLNRMIACSGGVPFRIWLLLWFWLRWSDAKLDRIEGKIAIDKGSQFSPRRVGHIAAFN